MQSIYKQELSDNYNWKSVSKFCYQNVMPKFIVAGAQPEKWLPTEPGKSIAFLTLKFAFEIPFPVCILGLTNNISNCLCWTCLLAAYPIAFAVPVY